MTRPMRTIGATVVTFAKYSSRRELVTVSVVCGPVTWYVSNRSELHGVITQLSAHHHPSKARFDEIRSYGPLRHALAMNCRHAPTSFFVQESYDQ